MSDAGYSALRESAAWLDLSGRGRIRAAGEDRARLLHALSTNHIQQLTPGQGCYAFFLNAQGRILADAVIVCLADSFLLNAEPEAHEGLYAHIEKYIIADDVALEDFTAETFQIGVEGPESGAVLARAGIPAPVEAYSCVEWNSGWTIRFATTGLQGYSIIGPLTEKEKLIAELEHAGVSAASPEAARVVRIENARPRYSEDLTDRYLPHETQALSAVHFNKGCYLGQEIVERVRSRGGVHRFLVPLEIEGLEAPAAGAKITVGEREVGEATSAAVSPARGAVVALGYARLNEIPAEADLRVGSAAARITARKPAGE